ncbi:hypothetical protein CNYM01_08099 [Colletotrichum nymphaeae SA-01]|uniref:Uncharacterized protein n=1 Tax=Colletotrichum nymphaeae SA-01 TaxID=1460502 RepID=A0A135T9R3_9PEZI|nr:hypothetical protein CNYM01_08099 [Colletotrichum nymphaeae SA-01]
MGRLLNKCFYTGPVVDVCCSERSTPVLRHEGATGDPLPEEFHDLAKLISMAVKEEAKAGTVVAHLYELILLVKISRAESEIEKLAKTARGEALVKEVLKKGNITRGQSDTNAKLLKMAVPSSLNLDLK